MTAEHDFPLPEQTGSALRRTESNPTDKSGEAVCRYLNFDQNEQDRQSELRAKQLQQIVPVLLPEGENADLRHAGWPVATLAAETLVVACQNHASNNGPLVLRSEDGGITWERIPIHPQLKDQTGPGMLAIGTMRNGAVILSARHGIFISNDRGKNWVQQQSSGLCGLDPKGTSGPRILDHPRHGLLLPFHTNEIPFHTNEIQSYGWRRKFRICLAVSTDGGTIWKEIRIPQPALFSSPEPTIFALGDEFAIVSRNHSGPLSGMDHDFRRWGYAVQYVPENAATAREITDVKFTPRFTNIFTRRQDTPDIQFNPVSARIEMVESKRNEGFPWRDGDCMSLNLWSIDPEAFRGGHANWRFECTLLRSRGTFSRSEHPGFTTREGLHPAGAVIDEKRGLQHIFICSGNRCHGGPNQGLTGVFRLSRSLDTANLVNEVRRLDRFDTFFGLNDHFAALDNWTLSGSPLGLLMDPNDRDVVVRINKPLRDGLVTCDKTGLHLRTERPGYCGLHHENALVLHNYRVEFKARITRYAANGDSLGLSINYGAQRHRMIIRQDGLYGADGQVLGPEAVPLDHDWHVWTVEMRDGVARIAVDGRVVGSQKAGLDDLLGADEAPVSIFARQVDPRSPAEAYLAYLKIANIEEK